MLSIFSYVSCSSVYILWRKFFIYLLPILWLGCLTLCYISCSQILEVNLFSISLLGNIFSHSVGCLSVYDFNCGQKLLSLIRSHLLIFILIPITLGDRPNKILLRFMSECVISSFFPQRLLEYLVLYLHLKSILSMFFGMTLKNVPNFFLHVAL